VKAGGTAGGTGLPRGQRLLQGQVEHLKRSRVGEGSGAGALELVVGGLEPAAAAHEQRCGLIARPVRQGLERDFCADSGWVT
jgi:hypothetical protein